MQYVILNDGNRMPQLGFGLFQVPDLVKAERVTGLALEAGYRLIDTAQSYSNEEAVGKAIKKSGIRREDLFVTSKLWVNQANYGKAKIGIDESLEHLGLDYLDMYLLHQPYGDVAGAWRALIEAQKAGKIKSIGVSNFAPDQVMNLKLMSGITPAVNQIEVSPWYQEKAEIEFNRQQGIQVEAWAPFAEGKHEIFSNESIAEIGAKHAKSNAQIILRWLLQQGLVTIPKSVHAVRMKENLDVFDFELSSSEMKVIDSLDRGKSQFFSHRDPQAIESIFGQSLKSLRD